MNRRRYCLFENLLGTYQQTLDLDSKVSFFNVVRRKDINIAVASPDMAAILGEPRISNDITLLSHMYIDFEMGVDPA